MADRWGENVVQMQKFSIIKTTKYTKNKKVKDLSIRIEVMKFKISEKKHLKMLYV